MIEWTKAIFDPDESGVYLVTMEGKVIGQKEPFTSMCGFEKGEWDTDGVLSWAPMPEPDPFWMEKKERGSIFK